MSHRLVILGSGTCQLQAERLASSVLVERGGLRLVFDMGRGIAGRLAELALRQDDVEHVVLSHFHPDHLSDLIPYLHAAAWSRIDPRSRDLHVYGPAGLEVQMMRLLALFGAADLRRPHYRVVLHEIEGEEITIAGHRFDFIDLPPAGNYGLRWTEEGTTVALTGDSGFHDQEVAFLAGSDVAVIDSGHLEDGEIVALAARSQAARILCSHIYRELDAPALERQARERGFAGRIEVARDRMGLDL